MVKTQAGVQGPGDAGTRPADVATLRADDAWESRSRRRYGNCRSTHRRGHRKGKLLRMGVAAYKWSLPRTPTEPGL